MKKTMTMMVFAGLILSHGAFAADGVGKHSTPQDCTELNAQIQALAEQKKEAAAVVEKTDKDARDNKQGTAR